ncbi:response regulator transcription factor [Streptacidiphilus monticola]|jgi:DNA-binding NarL/FixJ family response regulator|uniref:Response regulator transcription factor n=1 Tax=Streptacidiphilus monticola TaxID=2161674 RepID=A0ABW1G4D9_9ACTN
MRSSGSTSPAAVVVADSHRLVADVLALALAGHGYRVCATAVTRGELFRAAMAHRPDACLVDLRLLDGSALDVISLLHRNAPELRILVQSRGLDETTAAAALRAGASGFVRKDEGIDELVCALGQLTSGMRLPPPAPPPDSPAARRSDRTEPPDDPFRWLTRRELEVLVLLARGDGTVEIARGLEMTVNTARTHIQSVLDKLGVHSRLEAVALVNRLGVDLTAL